VAQVEEPGERGGAPGARGGVAIACHQLRELGIMYLNRWVGWWRWRGAGLAGWRGRW